MKRDKDVTMFAENSNSFITHFSELRIRIVRSLCIVFCLAIGAYFFFDYIMQLLIVPATGQISQFYFLKPHEAFMVRLKVSVVSACVFAAPYLLYEAWAFVVPGLVPQEKRIVMPLTFVSMFLFALGVLFAYWIILPFGLRFLLHFSSDVFLPLITMDAYIQFVCTVLLSSGIVFLIPIVIVMLVCCNVVSARAIASKRGHVLIGIFVLAAILTPPDVVTQCLIALPLYVLFEMSLLVSRMYVKRKRGNVS